MYVCAAARVRVSNSVCAFLPNRLHGELETARCNWDKYIKQASKETVARDTALLTAQETEARLKSELDRRRQETEK